MWGSMEGFMKTDLKEKMEELIKIIDNLPWKYEVNKEEIKEAEKLFSNLISFLKYFKKVSE